MYQPSSQLMLIWYLVVVCVEAVGIALAVALFVPVGIWATALMQHVVILSVLMYYLPWFYELRTAHIDALTRAGAGADDAEDI